MWNKFSKQYINKQCPKESLIVVSLSMAGVTVSSMNLDSSLPMPFSFHNFIEESQRYWPPSKQALNPPNICLDIWQTSFLELLAVSLWILSFTFAKNVNCSHELQFFFRKHRISDFAFTPCTPGSSLWSWTGPTCTAWGFL